MAGKRHRRHSTKMKKIKIDNYLAHQLDNMLSEIWRSIFLEGWPTSSTYRQTSILTRNELDRCEAHLRIVQSAYFLGNTRLANLIIATVKGINEL